MNKEEQVLSQLTIQVRNTYFLERRLFQIRVRGREQGYMPPTHVISAWDGGTDSRGVRHKAVWPKLIAFAITHQVSPIALVKAGFVGRPGNQPPFPQQLLTTEAVDKAHNFQKMNHEYLQDCMQAFRREAEQQVILKSIYRPDAPDSELWRDVITSPTLTAGALFRFCLACDMGQTDLARKLWDGATLEYIRNPDEYDQLLSKYLPKEFREGSRRLLQRVLSVIPK